MAAMWPAMGCAALGPAPGPGADAGAFAAQGATATADARPAATTRPEFLHWTALKGSTWDLTETWAGETLRFQDVVGRPGVHWTVLGSGVPIVSEREVPITLMANVLEADRRRFLWDQAAGVFLAEASWGQRLVPQDHPSGTPLLDQRGLAQEPQVMAALASNDPRVAREAIYRLAHLRKALYAQVAFPEAVPLLDQTDLAVRGMACWAAGECHVAAAAPALLRRLSDDDAAVRREAAMALGKGQLGGQAAIGPVAKLEADPSESVRRAAAWAQAVLRDARPFPDRPF